MTINTICMGRFVRICGMGIATLIYYQLINHRFASCLITALKSLKKCTSELSEYSNCTEISYYVLPKIVPPIKYPWRVFLPYYSLDLECNISG